MKHVKHVEYILPADRYIKQLPSCDTSGRKSTLRLNTEKIPNLQWKLANSYHITNIDLTIPSTSVISIHYINIDTLSYSKGNECNLWYGVSLNNNVTTIISNARTITSSAITCTTFAP